ncbi:MAG: DUF1013 domain-containing protein [Rickettsiales bacterium]|jgi:hypothetical protein|nr:DUF1013 domain-containing protein [Rickettsiales bacterium]
MKIPLMRRATALWLIENTKLTFEQISKFCDIHPLEIQGMADGEVSSGLAPQNPIDSGQLTRGMIEECENDPKKDLELMGNVADNIETNKKSRKNNTYIPLAKREEKPNAIMFLLKYYPNITDKQIRTLINTTTPVITSIREKTHWNIREIKPKDPVMLGLCSQTQFNAIVEEIKKNES